MEPAPTREFFELLGIVRGYQRSRAIAVAAQLNIGDLIATDRRSASDLARATGTDNDALYRLLRALASIGVLDEDDDRCFALTAMGEHLRSDHPLSVRPVALTFGGTYHWNLWRELPYSVRTGDSAASFVLGGDVWSYLHDHPDDSRNFDEAMETFTSGDNGALLAAHDFGRHRVIVDIGGGTGALLTAVLRRLPELRGVLFDREDVVAAARVRVAGGDLGSRLEIVAGSFFDTVPRGGDAYVLKRILHDWPDQQATAILQGVREAMTEGGRLLVVDAVVGPPNEDPLTKFLDLTMLVGFGGRERSLDEWRSLLAAGGFRLEHTTHVSPNLDVLEAVLAN